MGKIKQQLAEEAEADRQMLEAADDQSGLSGSIFGLLIGAATAQEAPAWNDEITSALQPGQGIEIKLAMEESVVAPFDWSVDDGEVNFDLHGDGGGNSISYEKGRAARRRRADSGLYG